MRLPVLALAVVAMSAPGTSAAWQHVGATHAAQLGHGYTAQVIARDRLAGSTIATRTLILRRGATVLQRFTSQDNALRLTLADVTGDEVRDVLAWNYTDGSGGCGSFRFYAGPRLREEYVHGDCLDTFTARLTSRGLLTWRAIGSSKSGENIHCCYSRWLETTRQWVHGRLKIVTRSVVSNTSLPRAALALR
jgi:hypothetical protein